MKKNDIPNWLGLLFSLIIWPLIIYFWSIRKKSYINNLTVVTEPTEISINNKPNIPAIKIIFINNTNSKIVLTNPKIKNNDSYFKIHTDSGRDFITGYYELMFHDSKQSYNFDYQVLRTSEKAFTSIGLSEYPDIMFYKYKPNFFRRIFSLPKYFVLEYTALVDNRSYQIKSTY